MPTPDRTEGERDPKLVKEVLEMLTGLQLDDDLGGAIYDLVKSRERTVRIDEVLRIPSTSYEVRKWKQDRLAALKEKEEQ